MKRCPRVRHVTTAAAALRDFTMNALLYDPIENKVLDFVGGVRDIKV